MKEGGNHLKVLGGGGRKRIKADKHAVLSTTEVVFLEGIHQFERTGCILSHVVYTFRRCIKFVIISLNIKNIETL